jgi:hypothetical protein
LDFLGTEFKQEVRANLRGDKMSKNLVTVQLEITQHVSKDEVKNYDEFIEVFEDADPYFIEDNFEHLNINSVSSNFKVGKCKEQGDTYCREIKGEVSFGVGSTDELKEFLEEEYVLDDGQFDGNRFLIYYIGDIDAVNIGEDQDGNFISVDIEDSVVNGSISFGS